MAFLAGLLILAALTVGYATSARGYQDQAPLVPAQLTAVRSQQAGELTLDKVTLTSRLRPTSRRTPSAAAQQPAATQQAPVVQQPVTPTPAPQTQTQAPSTGGNDTFDSSG